MTWLRSAQDIVYLVLSVAALGVELWALVDCLRRRPDAFVAAGKRTKNFWMLVTGVAALIGFATVASPAALGLLGIAALIGSGVYLADVKPALDQVTGRGSTGRQGPYGPW
ncbi:DUF2516 family protein [Phycicoccus sp. MAQZ13P-2]|uniref:DUF2516 family protein n=1 Tax=Phycicoccus mangrovi TaxID=2840470 RepID=UPI001C0073C2|nr:DUF2516 family protein [Phycicoccus mangrovi]MBT9254892.1 DUF2516 family protein [Phycicoccus mangrovi]MBT9256109.1 DUF2516 family protein [Phycicoccus mangrovi]MBT9273876.1 DUF2516 family protein [Phycicoccus mangrovi]